MQFKKLAAMAGSALMAGLTIAAPVLGATVSEVGKLNDLVTVTDSTVAFPTFVVGATAATEDVAGAINVAVRMAANAKTTEMISVEGGMGTTVTGGVQIGTATNPVVMGETLHSIRSSSFDVTDLPTILATQDFQPAGQSAVEYKQYLTIDGGDTAQIVYEKISGDDEPTLALKVDKDVAISQYELLFSTDVTYDSQKATEALKGQSINILGKDFVVSDVDEDATGITELTLLGGKNTGTVATGEDKDIGGYTIHLDAVVTEEAGVGLYTAVGTANGESFSIASGSTETLSDGTVIAAIKVWQGKTGEADYAKITVGADEIKLPANGGSVYNPDYNSEIKSTIVSTDTTWSKLTITYLPDDEIYLGGGDALEDAFAEAFSLQVAGFIPALDDGTNRQTITFQPDGGEQMSVVYENADGTEATVDLLWYNTTDATWKWGTETNKFIYSSDGQISADDRDQFVVQRAGYSNVLEFTGLENKTGGSSTLKYDAVFIEVGTADEITGTTTNGVDGSFRVGTNDYPFTIVDADNEIITVGLNGTAAYDASNTAFFMPGMIEDGDGGLYFTNSTPTTPAFQLVQEEDKNNAHDWILFPVGYASDQTFINGTTSSDAAYDEITISGGVGEYRAMSTYGTFVSRFTASEGGVATVSYPDSYMYANVYILEPEGAVTTSATEEGDVAADKVFEVTADVAKLDSEITDAGASDMVLVGGPCVNTLVSDLAADGKFAYTCDTWPGEDFGWIEVIPGAFAEGKTVLIIAGTRPADTDLACRVVQDGTKLEGKTASSAKVTGESFASVVVA